MSLYMANAHEVMTSYLCWVNLTNTCKQMCTHAHIHRCAHTTPSHSLALAFFLLLFQRAELADCPKVHSLTLKEEYEKASKKRDYHYEEEVLEFLRSFVRDNERKIESAKKRLDLVEDNPDMEAKVSLCVISSPSVLPPP